MLDPDPTPLSIIIPAHNESRTIRRLLDALVADPWPGEFEIIVICNGCTDDTAEVAAGVPGVCVVEMSEASKQLALREGDRRATRSTRVYVDADVEIGSAGIRELAGAMSHQGVIAVAPARRVELAGVSVWVRWYYDVWQSLPQVQTGLFGRGVIGVSAKGRHRVTALPSVMSDDLALSEAFDHGERAIVPSAVVVVRPPKTLRDLLRRRVRVATGNSQFDAVRPRRPASRTSISTMVRIGRRSPRLLPKIPVFLGVALISRLGARRRIRSGDFRTWLRDESSRAD